MGLRYGAWCIAAAAPPREQLDVVWDNLQCIGRDGQLPTLGGGPPAALSDVIKNLNLPLIYRTMVPRCWVDGSVVWHRLLARRWKFPVDIGTGELRVSAMWPRILARCGTREPSNVLDLGDNQGAVGVGTRGRSSRPWQNSIMRVWTAYEMISSFRMRTTWTPTWAQGADSGTRPDSEGRLSIGKVLWPAPTLIVQLGPPLPGVREALTQRGLALSFYPALVYDKEPPAVMARRVCRQVEDNTTILLFVTLGSSWPAPTREPSVEGFETSAYFALLLKLVLIAKRGNCKILIREQGFQTSPFTTTIRSLLGSDQWESRPCDLCRHGAPHPTRFWLHGDPQLVTALTHRCPHTRRVCERGGQREGDVVRALRDFSGALATAVGNSLADGHALEER